VGKNKFVFLATPEPYTCTGNFVDDFGELWIRSGLDKNSTPVICNRAVIPSLVSEESKGTGTNNVSLKVDYCKLVQKKF